MYWPLLIPDFEACVAWIFQSDLTENLQMLRFFQSPPDRAVQDDRQDFSLDARNAAMIPDALSSSCRSKTWQEGGHVSKILAAQHGWSDEALDATGDHRHQHDVHSKVLQVLMRYHFDVREMN